MGKGLLKVQLFSADDAMPVGLVDLKITGCRKTSGELLYTLKADENGNTITVEIEAPPKEYSLEPNNPHQPFYCCCVEIPAAYGFQRVVVRDVQIFEGCTAILPVRLHPCPPDDTETPEEIIIPREHGIDASDHGSDPFPDVWPEPESQNITAQNTPLNGDVEIMQFPLANEVQIPEFITVHLGRPNSPARNVRVPFIDYVKNVACSEIYPTWHVSALHANIHAQISFALNRIFTQWYRSRGFTFDITNSTQFDQFFVYGRNIFENISRIVDDIFNVFIRRAGFREPFLSSYCNGTTSTCPGMSQWGSQNMAVRGSTPIQILRHYYPNDVQLVESTNFIQQTMSSYPGTALRQGSTGNNVRLMQTYLNRISGNFWMPAPGRIDGVFGALMRDSVIAFQRQFNLSADGVIGRATWYEIIRVYVAVRRLAELNSEGQRIGISPPPPTQLVRMGDRGELVVLLQYMLNMIAEFYEEIPWVIENGVYREDTREAVVAFQRKFGLNPDAIVGPATWRRLYEVYERIRGSVSQTPYPPGGTPFPGTSLRVGSTGENVRMIQEYLRAIHGSYPNIPLINADGIFGPRTEEAVIAFQRQFGLNPDGIVGPLTWAKIMEVWNGLIHNKPPTPPTPPPPPPGPFVPGPYPGVLQRVGSRGAAVESIQRALNEIAVKFPAIPTLNVDGIFGPNTEASVRAFQRIFGLNPDGIVGPLTWGKLRDVLNNWSSINNPPQYPGTLISNGSRGNDVQTIQRSLNAVSAARNPSIGTLVVDGSFGPRTEAAVREFQRIYQIAVNGIVGPVTWAWLVSVNGSLNVPRSAAASVETSAVDFEFNQRQAVQPQALSPLVLILMMYGMNRYQ